MTERVPSRDAAEAVFVVGLPRSGTTLMRQVLNSHSCVAIAGENNYLGNHVWPHGARHRFRRLGDLRDDATISRIVDLIYSPSFQGGTILHQQQGFWRWLPRNVPKVALERDLLAGERSERGVFEVLLRAYAARHGKPIFGEKTPAHVRWAADLLDWYRRAVVVQVVRDPRAVYRSQLKRLDTIQTFPYGQLRLVRPIAHPLILAEVAVAWRGAIDRHVALRRRFPDRYVMVRFEDLVRAPKAEIERLCAFLRIAPEPAMLDQRVVSRGDQLGASGFDAGAADRWRSSLSPPTSRLLGRLVGDRLDAMGYAEGA